MTTGAESSRVLLGAQGLMTTLISWPRLDLARATLPAGEVHILAAMLDVGDATLDFCRALLSPEERERADRLHFPHHRARFIASHGLLRSVLATYGGTSSDGLRLDAGPHGKPTLEGLRFNLSHSGSMALVAVGGAIEVGVDVEAERRVEDLERIAARTFKPSEYAALMTLPPILRQHAFFLCWTRKEAYVKALGLGLAADLTSFEVSCTPGSPATLAIDGEPAGRWSIHHLAPAPGYVGAVIAAAAEVRVRAFQVDLADLVARPRDPRPPSDRPSRRAVPRLR
jgi:4'-phosphopantetheinyl transferase